MFQRDARQVPYLISYLVHIFKMTRGYRKIGPSYGLPVFYVEMGPGLFLGVEEALVRLEKLGLFLGATVVFKGHPLREKGVGVFIEGLKSVNLKVEVEEDGTIRDPLWFPKVDRWVVDWIKKPEFNYGVLRPRQDLLLCKSGQVEDILSFLKSTEKMGYLKGIMGNPEELWGYVKDYDVRVYEDGGESK